MRRYFAVGMVFLALLVVILGRLAYITLVEGEQLKAMADEQRTRSFDYYQYARGDFYDTLGRPLTSNEESCLVVFPTMVEDAQQTAASLAIILDIDAAIISSRLEDNNSRTLEPYVLKTGLTSAQTTAIAEGNIRGVLALPLAARYSSERTANHLLGVLSPADASGEYHGASGLEYQYDEYLSGRQDKQVVAFVDASGNLSAENLYLVAPEQTSYNNVQLTINLDYQQIAERAFGEQSGACVILDPNNGDILAAVSSPSYDPYGWEDLAADDVYINKAFSSYPPASTFKIILAAAALENNIIPLTEGEHGTGSADSSAALSSAPGEAVDSEGSAVVTEAAAASAVQQNKFYCDGAYTLAEDYDVACWFEEGHGEITLSEALAESCNCYFVGLGLAMGGDMIKEYAERFGLSQQSIIGYNFADTTHIDFSSLIDGDVANASIGEKGIRITPLQSAVMTAVCANGGYLLTPRLVKGVYDNNNNILEEFPQGEKTQTIPSDIAQTLKTMMTQTVTSGTGTGAAGSYTDVAGKTGTSEDAGVWFTGFSPIENPRWVISVYVTDGSFGSAAAAAIFREIVDGLAVLEGI